MSDLIDAVANWKIEATREDPDRFFWQPDTFSQIEGGEVQFVLGRKGTGKTAISHRLYSKKEYNRFATKLDFKSFPFEIIYRLSDTSYSNPHQYISAWRFVILSQLARLMAGNAAIDPKVREDFNAQFGGDSESPRKLVGSQFERSFGISIASIGSIQGGQKPVVESKDWWAVLDDLEEKIRTNIDDSKYYLLFDALDEDYKDMLDAKSKDQYLSLITGLFKAADNVRQLFSDFNVFPIVFLRSDIFDLISDSDRNKWSDYSVTIDWTLESIKRLLAFRIARSTDAQAEPENFDEEWAKLFKQQNIRYRGRTQKIIEFLAVRTFMRPRDFVFYMRECARVSRDKGLKRVSRVEAFYSAPQLSNHMLRELIDEIHPLIPETDSVFEVLQRVCRFRATFPFEDFRAAFDEDKARGFLSPDYALSPEAVMRFLYYFGAVGNRTARATYFRLQRRFTDLDFDQPITIHASLYSALGVAKA